MTGKNISDQLSFLPDDMIEEAMEIPKRQRTLRFTARVLRAAACLAVIIGLFNISRLTFVPESIRESVSAFIGTYFSKSIFLVNFGLEDIG